MTTTPGIKASQAEGLVVFRETSPGVKVSQAEVMVTYNVPAKGVNTSQAELVVPIRQASSHLNVNQAQLMVVYRGQVDNPKLKSWTYSLDSHDFFVLKLGTYYKTLIYDLTTQNWSWWTTNPSDNLVGVNWRASCGFNWLTAGNIPYNKGSNVIVGDDSTGTLWVLDPNYGLDDTLGVTTPQTFERTATGQITTDSRTFIPVYEVDLSFSNASPALTTDYITLSYSDNSGDSYITADGPITVINGNYYQELQWRALGQIRSPGRLFQITDNGACTRIDGLDVNAEVGN